MKMITDRRSNKVGELMHENSTGKAEMVWWFGKSSEQYRIHGTAQFIGDSFDEFPLRPGFVDSSGDESAAMQFYAQARVQQWGNLSDSAREQFFWKQPGVPLEEMAVVPTGGRDNDGKVVPVPPDFLLMLLLPLRVDYLRLTDNYRQIDTSEGGNWVQKRVNP
jgi:hypothetical protein